MKMMELLNTSVNPRQNISKYTDVPATTFPYLSEFLLVIKILSPLWPVIILFGVISNIINIFVFLKAGAKDNVTILLLCLAVSDLVFLILITPVMCHYAILAMIESNSLVFLIGFLLYWPAFTAYDLSAFISVSLGVMRCACVAMPLKFKLVFTKARTIKWVMFLVVLAVSLRIPVLTIHRISWTTVPQTNLSSPRIKAVNSVYMSRINDILNRGIVIYVLYMTMVTCVIILTFKLYQASKIRRSYTTQQLRASDQAPSKPVAQGLNSKDVQVVKSVVLVCIIFILSQLSFLLTSTTRLIRPDFDTGQQFVYVFGILGQINLSCSFLNASANIFIYYNYNSKYRSVLGSLLSVKWKK